MRRLSLLPPEASPPPDSARVDYVHSDVNSAETFIVDMQVSVPHTGS